MLNTGANTHDLRNESHQEMRTDRVEKAVHFDISQDDDVPMTASSGVQAKAQTASSGVQAKAQIDSTGVQAKAQTDSTGVQAKAQTTSRGSQPSTTERDQLGERQTTRIKIKDRGS